jgi:GntR family transcriptional regulator of arabinose operon
MHRYRLIYEALLEEIQSGVYKPGERLPSEAALCERFDASRITVAKAFQSLQQEGLVRRRPGSGTYVEKNANSATRQFGLLIPDLGTTEIFEAICQGLMSSPAAGSHSLAWGNAMAREDASATMERLCRQYISQKVSGVFFAPTEFAGEENNRRIAAMLEQANMPVVLLDRDFETYPNRSNFDFVGIDNRRAGYVQTQHLAQAGAKHILFAMRPGSANTVEARAAGYREAMFELFHGAVGTVVGGDFEDKEFVAQFMKGETPDGIVCANDVTAARLMRTLLSLGYRVPDDVRMIGLDDVGYAQFLPTPLTTLRQNCTEIGVVAMSVMLERIERPSHPVLDVRVKTDLVIRESCGMNRGV